MRLDDRTRHPKNRRAAGFLIIKGLFERAELAGNQKRAQLGLEIMHQDLFYRTADKLAHSFGQLEDNIAGKAVADRHVTASKRQVARLHIADKMNARQIFQQRQRRYLQLGALGLLRADVDEPNPGALGSDDLLIVGRTHHRKLGQHLGAAVMIRARVAEQVKPPPLRRNHRPDRRTLDPLDPLDKEGRPHQQRAGRAC